jgi:hypothetical protein
MWPQQGCQMVNFQIKKTVWVNFGRYCNGRCWNIFLTFGIFYGQLVNFVVIWYILWSFGTFCGHLVHFVVIWYILWSFGTFCGHLVHFFSFCYVMPRKIWQPWASVVNRSFYSKATAVVAWTPTARSMSSASVPSASK